jgi:hypothetical protein
MVDDEGQAGVPPLLFPSLAAASHALEVLAEGMDCFELNCILIMR